MSAIWENILNLAYLEQIWYVIFIALIIIYIILDGFDLGVGCLHLFVKKDVERRILLSAIGPFWDGNSVWLVIIGGALFAGFPLAYSMIFSAFYTPFMLLLGAIIFRTVSIEFRSKEKFKLWRKSWDITFSISSFLIAFALGLVLGNFITGIPIDEQGTFSHNLHDHLNMYSLIVAVTAVSLFMMHGSFFLLLKTEGLLKKKIEKYAKRCTYAFILMFIVATVATFLTQPHMVSLTLDKEVELFIITLCNLLFICAIMSSLKNRKPVRAFIFSCLIMVGLVLTYAVGTYPILLRSSTYPEVGSVTIFNAISSFKTLRILLLIVCIGVPLALMYMFLTYKTFKNKVNEDNVIY